MYRSDKPVLCANPPRGCRYCRWMMPRWCSAHESRYYPNFHNHWNRCYERAEHETDSITWAQNAFYFIIQRFRVCVISHLQEKFVDQSLNLFDILTHDGQLGYSARSENILVERTTSIQMHKNRFRLFGRVQACVNRLSRMVLTFYLRVNFVPADDEGHLTAPGVDETGPAGVKSDVVAVLTAEADGRMLKRRLARVLQNWGDKTALWLI